MTIIEEAIRHYEYGVTHDIFAEPVTSYALRSIMALKKQIPMKPIRIHEEYPEHLWQRDDDGEIDVWAFESGYHNGPYCTRCHHTECEHCNEDWETNPTEPCVIDKDVCPCCGTSVFKTAYCSKCGQALDWSE